MRTAAVLEEKKARLRTFLALCAWTRAEEPIGTVSGMVYRGAHEGYQVVVVELKLPMEEEVSIEATVSEGSTVMTLPADLASYALEKAKRGTRS